MPHVNLCVKTHAELKQIGKAARSPSPALRAQPARNTKAEAEVCSDRRRRRDKWTASVTQARGAGGTQTLLPPSLLTGRPPSAPEAVTSDELFRWRKFVLCSRRGPWALTSGCYLSQRGGPGAFCEVRAHVHHSHPQWPPLIALGSFTGF